jgi:signal peptidase I
LLRHVLILLCVAAFSLPAYFLASRFVVTAVVIQGRSMTPTLKDGERYYLNRWRYLFVSPDRGDLVVIKDPGHVDFAVKRIVARPKDWLNIRDGNIFLNGKRLDEPYLPTGTRTDAPDMKEKWIQLGEGQYYVLGDNRNASEDSRFYGVIHRAQILGILVR